MWTVILRRLFFGCAIFLSFVSLDLRSFGLVATALLRIKTTTSSLLLLESEHLLEVVLTVLGPFFVGVLAVRVLAKDAVDARR